MGFRFRKSIKVAPGVRLNLNKKSAGVTFGGKGIHYTINSKGKRTTTVGIPGTGISYSTTSGGKKEMAQKNKQSTTHSNTSTAPKGWVPLEEPTQTQKPVKKPMATWVIILLLCFLAPVGIYFLWKSDKFGKPLKIVLSIFFGLLFGAALLSSNGNSETPNSNNSVSSQSSVVSSVSSEVQQSSLAPAIVSESSSSSYMASVSSSESVASSASSSVPEPSSSSSAEAVIVPPASVVSSTVVNSTASEAQKQNITYVLNTSTMKIHYFSCSSVEKIKEKNYAESDLSVDELKAQGYKPCGVCHPN